jgi:hypothetical protein
MKQTTHRFLVLAVAPMALLATTVPFAAAETVNGIKALADFDYVYDLTVDPSDPSQIDLDGNSAGDWTLFGSTIDTSAGLVNVSGNPHSLRSTTDDEIWRTAPDIDTTNGYTIETSVRVNSFTEGEVLFNIMSGVSESTYYRFFTMHVRENELRVYYSSSAYHTAAIEGNADGEFHTYRAVQEKVVDGDSLSGHFTVYYDNAPVPVFDNVFGYNTVSNQFTVGDVSLNTANIDIDYVAFTSGPWAVVPEPATLTLLACAAMMLLIRRR